MNEEIEEVLEKPQSMLGSKVKQALLGTIENESKKALETNDTAYLIDLQNAKKLILKGAWKIRKANPFLVHMERCLVGQGGDLKTTQEAMKECAQKWKKLPAEKKKELEVEAGEVGIYDFL